MSFDRISYALRVAQNQYAIANPVVTPQGSASLINNTVLPGGQNFLQASSSDLQSALSTITNPDNYNSNRLQNQPSTDQIQSRINQLSPQTTSSPVPQTIPRTTPIPSSPGMNLSISPLLIVAGIGLLVLILR